MFTPQEEDRDMYRPDDVRQQVEDITSPKNMSRTEAVAFIGELIDQLGQIEDDAKDDLMAEDNDYVRE